MVVILNSKSTGIFRMRVYDKTGHFDIKLTFLI